MKKSVIWLVVVAVIVVQMSLSSVSAQKGTVKKVAKPSATARLDALEREAKKLKVKRDDLQHAMHTTRIELIKKKPELKKLHEKIMDLHKELSIRLDRCPEMKVLNKKAEKLDSEWENLLIKINQSKSGS